MTRYTSLIPYIERYTGCETVPLRVTMIPRSGGRLIQYDPPAIDGLLAWAVVHEATKGCGLPSLPADSPPYLLPLPLQCLWTSPEGLPLWAATPLSPVDGITDSVWETKRPQSGRFTRTKSGRFSLTPQTGRWRERMTPRPAVAATEWIGYCEGDPAEVARLLEMVRAVGKRRAAGFGEVAEWRLEEVSTFELLSGSRLTRSVPAEAAEVLLGTYPLAPAVRIAWTPPYWMHTIYLPGWPTGFSLSGRQ